MEELEYHPLMDFKMHKVIESKNGKIIHCVIVDGNGDKKLVSREEDNKWKILPLSNSDSRFLRRYLKNKKDPLTKFMKNIYKPNIYNEEDMYYLIEKKDRNIIYPIHSK